jgi:predicted nucleotidyltransferase
VPDVPYDLPRVLEELNSSGVRYVLMGGVAMQAHGSAHLTADIDLAYARDSENLRLLAAALQPLHPTLRGVPPDLPFRVDERTLKGGANFTFDTEAGELDILGYTEGVPFESLWQRSMEMPVYGYVIRVASIEDLITMKQVAGRDKDRVHIQELTAILKLQSSDH